MPTGAALRSAGILLPIYAWVVFILLGCASWIDPWSYGDWEISYAGGFVRRGASGELLAALSSLLGAHQTAFVVVNALAYLVLFVALGIKFAQFSGQLVGVMLFLPTSLPFLLWNWRAVGRKEALLLLFALGARAALAAAPRAARRTWLILGLGLAGLLLFHEAFLFFAPLIFVALTIGGAKTRAEFDIVGFALFIAPPTTIFVVLLLFGGHPDIDAISRAMPVGGASISALCQQAPVNAPHTPIAAVCYLGRPLNLALHDVWAVLSPSYLAVAVLISLGNIALATGLFCRYACAPSDSRAFTLVVAALAALLPLFVIALDWGRWIFVVTVLFAIALPDEPLRRDTISVRARLLIATAVVTFPITFLQPIGFTFMGPKIIFYLISARNGGVRARSSASPAT